MIISTVPICSTKVFNPSKRKLMRRVAICWSVESFCSFACRSASSRSRLNDLMTPMLSMMFMMPWFNAWCVPNTRLRHPFIRTPWRAVMKK